MKLRMSGALPLLPIRLRGVRRTTLPFFLGVFVKLRKATISCSGRIFIKFDGRAFFGNLSETVLVSLKSDKSNGHFTRVLISS